ncbi:hypothetical protein [Phytohabitans houttuyneae]|uniref:hypothetical protein n=1 Tax=Phytohabitans houttuyneae TaxID=1076126 RepID=UPI00156779DC|nr:hypothetical protein [Phytohabitans houttuyneae]
MGGLVGQALSGAAGTVIGADGLIGGTADTLTRPLGVDLETTVVQPVVRVVEVAAATVVEPVVRVVEVAAAAVVEPVVRVVEVAATTVLDPVVRVVEGTTATVAPILDQVLPPAPAPGDGAPPVPAAPDVPQTEQPPATQPPSDQPQAGQPPSDQPQTGTSGPGTAPTAAAASGPTAALQTGTERWAAAMIGPRVGANSSITKPPQQPFAAVRARTEPVVPGPGLGGGCVPGGCAHTSDAISAGGQPLVLPAVLTVRPDVRGGLVAPPAGLPFAGRLPGVAPLPG